MYVCKKWYSMVNSSLLIPPDQFCDYYDLELGEYGKELLKTSTQHHSHRTLYGPDVILEFLLGIVVAYKNGDSNYAQYLLSNVRVDDTRSKDYSTACDYIKYKIFYRLIWDATLTFSHPKTYSWRDILAKFEFLQSNFNFPNRYVKACTYLCTLY